MRHDERMPVTRADVDGAIRDLGLADRAVCVHSSLRSFGTLEGGPDTVIDAFLDAGSTLLVPSHSWGFASNHRPGMRPARNEWDYAMNVAPPSIPGRFSADSNAIDRNMGAIPRAVLTRPDRRRGNHPLASFSAIGPLAGDLVDGQCGDAVHAPLRALAELDGAIVMMGVGLTRMTLLHYAEEVAGRAQFRRWALEGAGTVMVESGGCSEGFERLAPVLAPIETDRDVGPSRWRCFSASAVVARTAAAIHADPHATHCGLRTCSRCNDAELGGPIVA
jgi:aminoglycoside 3-N-acetyltransferase